jgi:FtsP/CotA-like multicopper oxidase with cupredoxin domain
LIAVFALAAAAGVFSAAPNFGQPSAPQPLCGTPQHGRAVVDPPELFSQNGVLSVTLNLIGQQQTTFDQLMCWVYTVQTKNGPEQLFIPPTLHVKQGDRLEVTLVNDLLAPTSGQNKSAELSMDRRIAGTGMGNMPMSNDEFPCGQQVVDPVHTPDPTTGRIYSNFRPPYNEANLHFHGLNTSPKQPGDNTVMVLLCPRVSSAQAPESYNYVVDIPRNEPPGLYWYHPHPHGESEHQLLEQLTGAIVVDTINPSVPDNYHNRIIIVRDLGNGGSIRPQEVQRLRTLRSRLPSLSDIRAQIAKNGLPQPSWYRGSDNYPYGPPDQCPSDLPRIPRFNSKQLLVNGVELPPLPNEFRRLPYTNINAGQTEYWRLANTSSDTILDLQLLINNVRVPLQVTTRDGVPLVNQNGHPTWQPVPMNHVYLDPASRVEFFLTGTKPGDQIVLRSNEIDTGCGGDSDLERDLMVAHVVSGPSRQHVVAAPRALDPVPERFSNLGSQRPAHKRIFVLTEYQRDDSPEPDFYITELTNQKAVEHPYAMTGPPDVVVKDGTVEDWTILNYTEEVHAFHIHQIHFLVLKGGGIDRGEGQLLDTVDVPYGVFQPGGKTGDQMTPGAVTLRMDFRDKNIIGEFVYHCHILEHEDNGMMAKIRVVKP